MDIFLLLVFTKTVAHHAYWRKNWAYHRTLYLLFFLAYGLSSIVITVGIIVAERFGYATLVARKIKYTAYTYAPVVIGVGFLLLLALVVVLKTLQYFKIIR